MIIRDTHFNGEFMADSLSKVSSKWPAIIFAANRMASVIGRIILLILSINTINGISKLGVDWGIIWENIKLVLLNHPNIIRLSHRGKDKEIGIIIWLDLVKMYGNSPMKLLIKINIIIETR